jgi:hypothetical protein
MRRSEAWLHATLLRFSAHKKTKPDVLLVAEKQFVGHICSESLGKLRSII